MSFFSRKCVNRNDVSLLLQLDSVPNVVDSSTSSLVSKRNRLQQSLASQRALAASLGLLPTDSHDVTWRHDGSGTNQSNGGGRASAGNAYPVSQQWLHHWVYYLYTVQDDETVESPGPLEMGIVRSTSGTPKSNSTSSAYEQSLRDANFSAEDHSDDEDHGEANEYIPEAAWRRLADWYGVAAGHSLDRKLLNGAASFNDRVEFEICLLSAFCGIIEHQTTWFNRFEEVGIGTHMNTIAYTQIVMRTACFG
jgi:DUSP domain